MDQTVKEFWQINIGQIVSVFAFLVGAVIVWQKMRDKLESLEEKTNRNTNDINEMTKIGIMTTVQQHERRICDLEIVASDYREMKTDIRWIKEKITKESPNQ